MSTSNLKQRMENVVNSPRATDARIEGEELRLRLTSGATVLFRARDLRPLKELNDEQLAEMRLVSGGSVLMWPSSGQSIAVEGLLEAITGLHTLKTSAAKGGSATTEAKSAAARANGTKGGRPRKPPVS